MSAVTIPGADGSQLVLYVDYPSYAALAKQLLGNQTGTLITTPGTYAVDSMVTGVGPANGPGGNPVFPGIQPLANAGNTVILTDAMAADGQLIVTGDGFDVAFTATAGSGTVIGGGGNDTFTVGAGDWTLETSASGSTVNMGDGNDTVTLGGEDLVNITGTGEDLIFNAGPGDGTPGGGSTINGGSGNLFYVAGPSSVATINGGSGETVAFGAASSVTTYNGAGVGFFVAGGGNETVDASGSSGENVFFAGTGDTSMMGGSGNDFLAAGQGNSTLGGGDGSNLFAFFNHAGSISTDTVTDFSSTDYVAIVGSTISSETVNGNDLDLKLSDGTQITFTGITSIDASHITVG